MFSVTVSGGIIPSCLPLKSFLICSTKGMKVTVKCKIIRLFDKLKIFKLLIK